MATETQDDVVEQPAAESQESVAAQEAAFEAGFASVRGDEPPTQEAAPAESDDKPAVQTEAQPKEATPEPAAVLAGMTEDQIKALLVKAGEVDGLKAETETRVRQVFGKLGELNSLVQQLQKSRSESTGVKLDPSKLTRLNTEFPEMAQMLAADLAEALAASPAGQASVDPAQVDQLVSSRLSDLEEKLQHQMEMRWLSRTHKDWQSVVGSSDFRLWKDNVLAKDEAARLDESWDAEFIGGKLSEFKDWKEKSTRTATNKQKRLEAALTPQGAGASGPTAMTEEDAFLAGWKAVRGG